MEFIKTLKSFGKVVEFLTRELNKLITSNFYIKSRYASPGKFKMDILQIFVVNLFVIFH